MFSINYSFAQIFLHFSICRIVFETNGKKRISRPMEFLAFDAVIFLEVSANLF